jgi:hypothetical protein
LPEEHAVSAPAAPPRTPEAVHEYWLQFRAIWSPGFETVLEDALSYALDLGVRPRLTKAVVQAAVQARSIRKRRSVPLPLTYASFNFLPSFIAAAMFRRLHARSRLARLLMRLWPEALW